MWSFSSVALKKDIMSAIETAPISRFKPKTTEEWDKSLRKKCEAIAAFQDQYEEVSYEIDVDSVEESVRIIVKCKPDSYFDPETSDDMFFDLLDNVDMVVFDQEGEDTMIYEFVYRDVWGHTIH